MTDYTRTFESIRLSDREIVGGKCASIGELIQAGARVPAGNAVTTAAFEEFLRATELSAFIKEALQDEDVERASLRIAAAVASGRMPTVVSEAIHEAYESLGSSSTPVAVRSSAVAEDSDRVSFAGLQETYVWVRGQDDVIQAVRRIWASVYSPAAIVYRRRMAIPIADARIAVGIQKMVDARVAGVLFTLSPRTGDRSAMAINASWGLGTTVVGGEVTPDEYWVDKVTGELRSSVISDKAVRAIPGRTGAGTLTEPVPDDLRRRRCLQDEEIAELARLGKHLEAHYGHALDIEWALAVDEEVPDSLYVLQARPETVWSNKPPAPVMSQQSDPIAYVMRTFLPPGE